MRLLILGGTAFLGRATARAALERGHQVTCLARGTSGQVADGADLVVGDRADTRGYADLVGDFDAVVDVARQPRHVRTALDALTMRVDRWLFVSTINVYADVSPSAVDADESAPLLPAWDGEEWAPEQYGAGKVTCESLVAQAFPSSHLIARAGLLGGPEDVSDRTGYWPLRFAHPSRADGRVLVPHSPDAQVQLIDVRDLARWLVVSAESGTTGVFNANGPSVPLHAAIAAARGVAAHTDELVPVPPEWLAAHGVSPWMGERSLPLWVPWPDLAGMMTVDTTAAQRAGLTVRPLPETFIDALAWELQAGPGRARKAGLSPADEADLITQRLSEPA
ncbi:NAD-dependent epimerase/dehydratase family protein [Calidifontibacter indicus]|uniref:NAD-dependent epimerase/dehydratase family protein n=1 Tax=Calidifontibacter indicus TaxID=419650 RepID=UPI003D706E92